MHDAEDPSYDGNEITIDIIDMQIIKEGKASESEIKANENETDIITSKSANINMSSTL